MIIINNVLLINNKRKTFKFNNIKNIIIDGSKLLAIPALIDPHVHFRTPGYTQKENWISGSLAALKGGYSMVFDMPNTKPTTITHKRLLQKISVIDKQLKKSSAPLKYKLFFGADKNNFQEIHKVKDLVIGIKVFMGSSTGELLMNDESSLHAIFALAKTFNLIIATHAEDEGLIKQNIMKYGECNTFDCHSKIRNETVATKAVSLAINLAKSYQVKTYILHISTKKEIELIKNAKKSGVPVFAETCPHYLYLDIDSYTKLNGFAKVNPPLRNKLNQKHLWKAINDGVIDTVASDHAPHLKKEKNNIYNKCPSGMPGIETTLPLIFTAYKQGKIRNINTIINVLNKNAQKIFNIEPNHDLIFINIEDYKFLNESKLATKVKWSPYKDLLLTGFPEYAFINNKFYNLKLI